MLRVEDAMTGSSVTVQHDATIGEVARAMRHHRVHRVLVLREGSLVGLISSFDLVALLEG